MSQSAEQQWLERIRAGDGRALAELLQAHQRRLYNVCLRMLSNRDDAAEATQETMLKIVEHIGTFRGESQVSTWMIRIAMNQATTRLRRRRRRPTVSLDGHANGQAHDDQAAALRDALPDTREPAPGASVETSELRERLVLALAKLDETFRAVVVLRDVDGLDYQQIAEVLDLPVGTVKSRLFRARLALRQQLQEIDHPADPRPVRPEVSDE